MLRARALHLVLELPRATVDEAHQRVIANPIVLRYVELCFRRQQLDLLLTCRAVVSSVVGAVSQNVCGPEQFPFFALFVEELTGDAHGDRSVAAVLGFLQRRGMVRAN
jgi:hypothetical protein